MALCIISLFFISYTFANTNDIKNAAGDTVNTVRNVIGGTENAVEGAVKDVTNGVKDTGNNIKNDVNNGVNNVTDGTNNNNNTGNMNTTGNNNGYTANRTATETRAMTTTDNTFLGMTTTMWTWLMLAVAAVVIIGLVWYYSNQISNNKRYDNNGDE